MGIGLFRIAISGALTAMIAFALLAGISEAFMTVTYITVRAAHSPDHLLGRVGSTARVISLGLQPLGMLAGGILIDATNGTTTMAVTGAAICVLAVGFAPVRALRQAA